MNSSYIKSVGIAVTLFFVCTFLQAQNLSDSAPPSFDKMMQSNNKIYVVMAVCIVILVVLLLYLIRIDRKVSKKEKAAE